jgi:hypothetical protein
MPAFFPRVGQVDNLRRRPIAEGMATETQPSETRTTTDHDEIRRWAEAHGGRPAVVKGTEILRIDFPGGSGEDELDDISWDEWFDIFDRNGLAFLYQEQKAGGEDSTFHKIVSRDQD